MGNVEKKAVLKPLAARADQHSFFLMGDTNGDSPTYLPGVSLELVEWPRTLVMSELFDSTLALDALPDGSNLELSRIPGNRAPGNYQMGEPLMRFDNCVKLRQFARFDGGILELGVVFDCTVTIL